jgi:hypothetical protein
MFNASRSMRKALHFESIGCSDQEASSRHEEASRFEAHTRFDEAVSDSPSGADSETASWPPPISILGSQTARTAAMNRIGSSVIQGKIEGISVSPMPRPPTAIALLYMNPPASRLIFYYFSNEQRLGLILQICRDSYLIEFLRGTDCILLRVKWPPGNLFSQEGHAPVSQR